MKFEAIKDVHVMDGKVLKTIRAGKTADSRDWGITEKSLRELVASGRVHVEHGQKPDDPKAKAREENRAREEGK